MFYTHSTITVISGGKKDTVTDRHTQRQIDRQRQTTDCQMLSAARAGVVVMAVF